MDAGQLDFSQIESAPDLADFMPGANDADIVYELMLRQRNLALSESLEQLSDIGRRTYLYGGRLSGMSGNRDNRRIDK